MVIWVGSFPVHTQVSTILACLAARLVPGGEPGLLSFGSSTGYPSGKGPDQAPRVGVGGVLSLFLVPWFPVGCNLLLGAPLSGVRDGVGFSPLTCVGPRSP